MVNMICNGIIYFEIKYKMENPGSGLLSKFNNIIILFLK